MKRTLLAIAIGAISAGLAGGALAQENDVELEENGTVGEEQSDATQGDYQDSQADDDQNADDTEADISVDEDELPDEGDDAEDYEELRDDDTDEDNGQETDGADDANGDEAATDQDDLELNVEDDETQADPGDQATTEPSAAEAEQAPEGEQTPQAGQAAQQEPEAGFEEMGPTGADLDPAIASLQVGEVEGMTIVNIEGETLGQVENVLRHNDAGDLHAVVSVGGFWIFGGSDVTLPLADMRLEGDQLVLQDIIGQDELDDIATDYDEDRYTEVDDDLTLSEAMGR
ncbi:MAG: PRC-barrel domain-containing protein [Halomonas sp.]|nr:PRC-barrel domain-containing protein [Halomonas sp.]MCC5882122.1 PRC-barrel domain-containing protein [Halomonas sp.]